MYDSTIILSLSLPVTCTKKYKPKQEETQGLTANTFSKLKLVFTENLTLISQITYQYMFKHSVA